MNIAFLKCSLCGTEYATDEIKYVCPNHRDSGLLDVIYDYDKITSNVSSTSISDSRDFSIWRYWELLPIQNIMILPA